MDMDLSDIAIFNGKPGMDPETKFTPHTLLRQDDNGVRSLVEVFPCRASASKRMRDMEAAGHKQTYWIECTTSDCASFRVIG